MAQIIKRVFIPRISDKVLVKLIEVISEALIRDAKENFGSAPTFSTRLRVDEKRRMVNCRIYFWPYSYNFGWILRKEGNGHEVVLNASTDGKWYEWIFDAKGKLIEVTNTLWSALLNFSMGYLTALAYERAPRGAKRYIKAAKAGIREK